MLRSAKIQLAVLTTLALAVAMAVGAGGVYVYFLPQRSPDLSSSLIFAVLVLCFLVATGGLIVFKQFHALAAVKSHYAQISIDNLSHQLDYTAYSRETFELIEAHNAMLEQLEDAVRRIRQFSGDASHELRTPLTILRGETEVALHWAKTTEEFRDALQSNMEEIDRMGRILEDLLTLAKSESGDLPLAIKPLSLSDLLQELYLQGRALAEAKQIEVNLHYQADGEITLRGDDLRLRQLFLNLLTNAIRYTHDKGNVDIDVSHDENQVTVAIRDNGIGIAEEHLDHIFERFYRTDEARNRAHGGTGLGLAIVKWVAEAHDGSIRVSSTPGTGSKFEVCLPLNGPQPKTDLTS